MCEPAILGGTNPPPASARIYLSPKDVRALALRIKELEKRRILERHVYNDTSLLMLILIRKFDHNQHC